MSTSRPKKNDPVSTLEYYEKQIVNSSSYTPVAEPLTPTEDTNDFQSLKDAPETTANSQSKKQNRNTSTQATLSKLIFPAAPPMPVALNIDLGGVKIEVKRIPSVKPAEKPSESKQNANNYRKEPSLFRFTAPLLTQGKPTPGSQSPINMKEVKEYTVHYSIADDEEFPTYEPFSHR